MTRLHLALSGATEEDGTPVTAPFLWILSRLCEEFGGYPTRALWELEHDPDQMAVQILELRGYAAAKREYEAATNADEYGAAVKRNAMVTLVRDIEHAIQAEKLRRLKEDARRRAEAAEI